MRFRYPLQKVVDLKGNEKAQAEWLLSAALAVLHHEQLSLAELRLRREEGEQVLQQLAQNPVTVGDMQTIQHHIDHLDKLIERKLAELAKAEREVDGKRQQLLVRTQDEKVWQKAREKAFNRYQYEQSRIAQAQLDEIAANRHSRQP